MRLTDRQGAVIYNLGALISYVSLVMLLLDALHVARHHNAVTWTRLGFAICDELAGWSRPQSSLQVGAHLASRERLDSDSDFFSSELPMPRGWDRLTTTTSGAVKGTQDHHQKFGSVANLRVENGQGGAWIYGDDDLMSFVYDTSADQLQIQRSNSLVWSALPGRLMPTG